MLNRAVLIIFNWKLTSFWLQLSRIRQVLLLLVFLPSLVGVQLTRANAARALAVPAATQLNDPGVCVPVKIMPLGDSITYDYQEPETRPTSERVGYRLPLWELLIAGGYSVDFVGSRVAGEALGQDLVPPFDPDNEGHSGWRDDQIAAEIYTWLAATPADVVLLHIGTNALDTSPGDVEDILNEIDRWEADSGKQVTVLLARIINRSIYSADTTAFNNNVAAMAQTRIVAGDELILVDIENGAGLNYGVDKTFPYTDGDLYDYLHPNEAGYAKMASAWFNGDSSGSPGLTDILPDCEPQTAPGPLGHWRFDESSWAGDCSTADILDSSGNNRHGAACINGDAPVPVPGKFGNAGLFDGVNEYANMGPGFNFTSSFTAALWIALDDYDSCGPSAKSQHIIGTHHNATPAGNGRGWGIYWDCDGLAWELTNSTGSAIESYGYVQPSPFPASGSWHHIALAYDASVPSATLYWDGVPIYSESGTGNVPSILFNNGEPLTINGLPYAPGAGAPGKIDDARVYNRALSGAEIQMLFGNPPPVTFSDVPTNHWAWAYIESLFNAGVTSGCSALPMMYCPATTVTRDQMAVFLLKARHTSSYTPPSAAGVFQDVPASFWAAAWIEQLATEGITSGCASNPMQYCPGLPVTRDQMAVFLLKAKHGSNYMPPEATGMFEDVPVDYWAAAWIEQLADEGITAGCDQGNYCPTSPVTRDQMAVFLVRSFNLPLP